MRSLQLKVEHSYYYDNGQHLMLLLASKSKRIPIKQKMCYLDIISKGYKDSKFH